MISCVPYNQNTLEYGPRDYLNQLVALMSGLRGSQQRYMPLLLSKINDSTPNALSYALPPVSEDARASDIYASSDSSDSTAFGSPPLSATVAQSSLSMGFSRGTDMDNLSGLSALSGAMGTTSIDFGVVGSASPGFPNALVSWSTA